MKQKIHPASSKIQNNSNGLVGRMKSIHSKFVEYYKSYLLISVFFVVFIFAFASKGWAQIAVRGSSTANVNAMSITINRPAGVVQGDLMIVTIAKYGDNVTTSSSFGWTLIDGRYLGNSRYGTVLYRVAGASEPANYIFSLATTARQAVGSIVAFSGVDSIAPFDVAPGNILVSGSSVNVAATSITTVTANAAVVMLGMSAYNSSTVNFLTANWSTTSPGALTEIYDNNRAYYATVGAAWAIKATAGATGAGAAQLSANRQNGGILLALRPRPICTGLAPTTQANNVTFTATCVPLDITWTRGNGNYCAVFMKNTNSGTALPVDGTAYTASSTFQAGDQIGSSGWFCVYNGSGTSVSVTNINPGLEYSVHVCEYNCSGASIMYNTSNGTTNNPNYSLVSYCYYHPTTGINGSSVGECMTIISSPSIYYDDGGPSANYSTNITHGGGIYRTFCPAGANQAIRATITSMDIHTSDELTIVNGASASGSLGTLWAGDGTVPAHNTNAGNWSGGIQTSTDFSGCLTFRFNSSTTNTGAGWEISLTTVASANWRPPVNSDCQTATTICNTESFSGSSFGPGLASSCPAGCLGTEYYTNWYVWKIGTGGSLLFTIDPAGADDYDFALFRASDCSVMGDPVRCSFYTSTVNTGLNASETDTEESASIGNSLVSPLNVNSGEYYFLMISNYTRSGTGFTLTFGGTCKISCESPLPVELLSFETKCEDNGVTIDWSTATETNNDYFTIERSDDVSNWNFVSRVQGAGNSNSIINYSIVDDHPLPGISYYRLKQTDFDGHVEYFNPLAVNCTEGEDNDPLLNYYPNPFSGFLYVDVQKLNFKMASITVYDMIGNIVFQKEILKDEFFDKKTIIDLSNLSSGIYMINFTTDKFTNTRRILKSRE